MGRPDPPKSVPNSPEAHIWHSSTWIWQDLHPGTVMPGDLGFRGRSCCAWRV